MRKVGFLLVMAFLLSGCAVWHGAPDDPRINRAAREASKSLKQAREHGAPDHSPELYEQAKSLYDQLETERQQSPSRALISRYRTVEILAKQSTIKALLSRLEELKGSVSDQSRLRDRIEKLEQKNNRLARRVDQLRGSGSNLEERLRRAQSRIEDLEAQLEEKQAQLTRVRSENQQIVQKLNRELEEGKARQEKDRVYIRLQSKILFGLGSVNLRGEAQETLQTIAAQLKEYPDRPIRVEGHTDDLPLKGNLKEQYGSNWELSAHRAIEVLKYLVYSEGIARDRIGAVAFGQFQPRVPNTSTENRQKNRRVEIALLPPDRPVTTRDLDAVQEE